MIMGVGVQNSRDGNSIWLYIHYTSTQTDNMRNRLKTHTGEKCKCYKSAPILLQPMHCNVTIHPLRQGSIWKCTLEKSWNAERQRPCKCYKSAPRPAPPFLLLLAGSLYFPLIYSCRHMWLLIFCELQVVQHCWIQSNLLLSTLPWFINISDSYVHDL